MKALYAFSGDPVTYGHIDIVKRAARIFDRVIVGIGINPDKEYLFSLEERLKIAQESLKSISNVDVVSIKGLIVDYAYENNIPVIVKGLRSESDFRYEINLHRAGEMQELGIDTFFIPARPEFAQISSSVVKALQKEHGFIHQYVPLNVKKELEEKISSQYILGITGEIASGKSYLADRFIDIGNKREIEVHNIDLDKVGHHILEDLDEPVYDEIRQQITDKFGYELKNADGTIDRKKLGEVVFSDQEKLKALNEIMHQSILVRIRKDIYDKKGIIILNAALFAETEMMFLFNNNVILTSVSQDIQTQRLRERGFNDDQIRRRVESQFSTDQKREILEQSIKREHYGHLWEASGEMNDSEVNDLFNEVLNYFEISKNEK